MGTYTTLIPDNEFFEAKCSRIADGPDVCLHLEWGRHSLSLHLPSLPKAEALALAIARAVNKLTDEELAKRLPPVPLEQLPF